MPDPQLSGPEPSGPEPHWDVMIRIAVEAGGEAEARSLADQVLGAMEVTPAAPPPFVRFEDGSWATEVQLDDTDLPQVEPDDAFSVLSRLKMNLDPLTWRGTSDTPFDPESARVSENEFGQPSSRFRASSRLRSPYRRR